MQCNGCQGLVHPKLETLSNSGFQSLQLFFALEITKSCKNNLPRHGKFETKFKIESKMPSGVLLYNSSYSVCMQLQLLLTLTGVGFIYVRTSIVQ